MRLVTLEDVTIYWSAQKEEDGYILYGTVFLNGLPQTMDLAATCELRLEADVLGLNPGASRSEVTAAYRRQARAAHPDQGGTREDWDRLQAAYEQALAA